jgi:hypothetical protein
VLSECLRGVEEAELVNGPGRQQAAVSKYAARGYDVIGVIDS